MRHWSIVKYFSLAHLHWKLWKSFAVEWKNCVYIKCKYQNFLTQTIFFMHSFYAAPVCFEFFGFFYELSSFSTLDRVIDAEWFVINHPDICNYQRLWAVHNRARTSFKCHFCLQQSSSCLRVFWQGQHIFHSKRWRGFRTFDLCFSVFTCSSHSRVLLSNVENSLSLYKHEAFFLFVSRCLFLVWQLVRIHEPYSPGIHVNDVKWDWKLNCTSKQ